MSITSRTEDYRIEESEGFLDGCWSCLLQDYEEDEEEDNWNFCLRPERKERQYDRIKTWGMRRLKAARQRQEKRKDAGDRQKSILKSCRPFQFLRRRNQ